MRASSVHLPPTIRAAFARSAGGVFWITSHPYTNPWCSSCVALLKPDRCFRFCPSTCARVASQVRTAEHLSETSGGRIRKAVQNVPHAPPTVGLIFSKPCDAMVRMV